MSGAIGQAKRECAGEDRAMTKPLDGESVTIGSGFSADSFRAQEVGTEMDPLVLVDHYVMTEPTFGTHPHAGLSAVSLLFQDSTGRFRNRDSLGNDVDLLPGDLYWLNSGCGALHNESPRDGSRTHGLQIFINVPQELRYDEPSSLLVRRQAMPVLATAEYRVWVALGESQGVGGASPPGSPVTILDGQVQAKGEFAHELASGRSAWIHAVEGGLDVSMPGNSAGLRERQAIAIDNSGGSESITLRLLASERPHAHFVLLEGMAVREPYVQQGPFVMRSKQDIEATVRAYEAGRFGSIY
jgi:redox-sensitive bicupin YhaK (pirin superfamily)